MILHLTERARDMATLKRDSLPWLSRKAMGKSVAHELYLMGEAVTLAEYDNGTCTLCGEAGRCPGVHAVSELERAMSGAR